jgi:hypothetical protein
MEPFNTVLSDPNRSTEMQAVQRRIQRFICGVMPNQNVVGNREDYFTGQIVTSANAQAKDRSAHVCPFVDESIQRDYYWIEESLLTSQTDIESLLLSQIPHFLNDGSPYNPVSTDSPAGTPHIWKTYMTIFPNVTHPPGSCPMFDSIHTNLKSLFYACGLALGQFYYKCTQGAIYNPSWTGATLSMPYPAFALRYLVKHDRLFTPTNTSTLLYKIYKHYFP